MAKNHAARIRYTSRYADCTISGGRIIFISSRRALEKGDAKFAGQEARQRPRAEIVGEDRPQDVHHDRHMHLELCACPATAMNPYFY